MHRTSSSIRRHALNAALGTLLLVLAGCGSIGNPVAPIVTPSNQAGTPVEAAKALKHDHTNGRSTGHDTQTTSGGPSGAYSGGGTSGSFSNPGDGEPNEPLVIE